MRQAETRTLRRGQLLAGDIDDAAVLIPFLSTGDGWYGCRLAMVWIDRCGDFKERKEHKKFFSFLFFNFLIF